MHHEVATPQDLVPVIRIPGLEPERPIERPRAREIEDWEDRFRTLWSHGCLLGYAHEQLALPNGLVLSCRAAAGNPSNLHDRGPRVSFKTVLGGAKLACLYAARNRLGDGTG
jgi:hypothetical protein